MEKAEEGWSPNTCFRAQFTAEPQLIFIHIHSIKGFYATLRRICSLKEAAVKIQSCLQQAEESLQKQVNSFTDMCRQKHY